MSKSLKKILIAILSVMLLVVSAVLLSNSSRVKAENLEAKATINYCTLAFEENVYILYAVKTENTESVPTLVVRDELENEYNLKYTYKENIEEVEHYIFVFDKILPKQMGDDFYAKAVVDGNESEELKYSVVQYVKNIGSKLDDGNPLKEVFTNMLNYGASVQKFANYKLDRLVTKLHSVSVVNGVLEGGYNYGIYSPSDTITITADKPQEGYRFIGWESSLGRQIDASGTVTISVQADEIITAKYQLVQQDSVGLAYSLINNDTEYSVTGKGTCTDTKIVIPEIYKGKPVTSIGNYAFLGCSSLTSIEIPNSVTSIGSSAFFNCSSLTSVTIGNGVTSIGNYAFAYCRSLTSVTIGNSVTSIGDEAFRDCSSLTSVTIGNSVTEIGDSAFSLCSSLTSITIPNSVTSIGYGAFEYCSSLTNVTIPNSVTSIGDSAFADCSSLTSIAVNENNKNYKSIDGDLYSKDGKTLIQYAAGKTNTSFTIPNSVTSIGYMAFYNRSSLTSIEIPNSVTSIGYGAFEYCSSLTNVTIPNGVISIGGSAFFGCSSLTSIVIPNSVTSIGKEAFYGCYKLVEVINLSNLYITIDSYGLDALNVKNSGSSDIVNKDGYLFYTVDNTNYLFGYVGNETELTLPDNYNGQSYEIYKYAFYNCSSLTSIEIPNSVTSIGFMAFYDCSSLTSVTIGNSVTSIGDYAFYNCSKLTSVTIPNSVTSIGSSAFEDCSSLTSIEIPNSVTSIGYYAFCKCSSLTSIEIPNSVTSIGEGAFRNCSLLQYNEYDNGLYLGNSENKYVALIKAKNTSITSCQINDRCKVIASGAFEDCSSLTSIEIPNSVTSIGEWAFEYCSKLTSIEIPNSVTSISDYAFKNCSSLTSITFSGTQSEWQTIKKDADWKFNVPSTCKVYCSDGVLDI